LQALISGLKDIHVKAFPAAFIIRLKALNGKGFKDVLNIESGVVSDVEKQLKLIGSNKASMGILSYFRALKF
jgi:hypothetical protein